MDAGAITALKQESQLATAVGAALPRATEQECSSARNDVGFFNNERSRRAQEITIVISENENLRSSEGP